MCVGEGCVLHKAVDLCNSVGVKCLAGVSLV